MNGGWNLGLPAVSITVPERVVDFHDSMTNWVLIGVVAWIVIMTVGGVALVWRRRRGTAAGSDGAPGPGALRVFRWAVAITVVIVAATVILDGLPVREYHVGRLVWTTFSQQLDARARVVPLLLVVLAALAQIALVWLTRLGGRLGTALACETVLWVVLGLGAYLGRRVATVCVGFGTGPRSCPSHAGGASPPVGRIVASAVTGVLVGIVWFRCTPHLDVADPIPDARDVAQLQ